MDATSSRWRTITEPEYPWERAALDFVRGRLPDHDPYRAWANFEFIADDGSINEVDLLVLTPKGFYLVEIKSWPGVVEGDQGRWTWTHEGRRHTVDNPLLLANRKAKKLIALLRRQKALQAKASAPFLAAHVFLSHEAVDCRLGPPLSHQVHVRDSGTGRDERPGIVAALTRHSAGPAPARPKPDSPLARALTRAMKEAGIRRSQRARTVGDYRLGDLLFEGPNYQDWEARHTALERERARVRIYAVPPSASDDERAASRRAARREYEVLKGVRHEGILAAKGYTEHERGPALVFEHPEKAQRFDHWLAEHGARLDLDARLHLLRQIADTLHYAHGKGLIHRALAPQSILVVDPAADPPRVQVFNWQTAARQPADVGSAGGNASGTRTTMAATRLDALVEDQTWAYMAPEAATARGFAGESVDVFSLGAIAFHLFAGAPPAASLPEMTERLRREQGLQLSSAIDGVNERLQLLVQLATQPDVTARMETVRDFLNELDRFEDEITRPDEPRRPDPLNAHAGDKLEHGLVVKGRLGKGSTAVALLVERGKQEYVLKVALKAEHDDRLRAEADVLRRLRHQHIVEWHETLEFAAGAGGRRVGLLLARAGEKTLADRLREEGRLHLELLERFGADLLATVDWLEQQGVPHRDIKPENLGTAKVGKQLHLVLFDFSLTRTPAENILAGTRDYLDPFLQTRRQPRWDTHAERFAAAVTLHRMAAGSLPRWGDGRSEPAVLDCEATIDAEVFEPDVREGLTAFFQKALRRDYHERFDNADEMLRAWRQIFLAAARSETNTSNGESPDDIEIGADTTLDTPLAGLGLSARVMEALDRIRATTVKDLLRYPLMELHRLRGVGSRTRHELAKLAQRLAERFPDAARGPKEGRADPDGASVDALHNQLLPAGRTEELRRDRGLLAALLGLKEDGPPAPWPSPKHVAEALHVTPAAVDGALDRARQRWGKSTPLTRLRNEVVELLEAHGRVMTQRELAAALLARRGSVQEEPLRSRHAAACVRAAAEVERQRATPRWIVRRLDGPAAALLARDAIDDRGERGAPPIDGEQLADFAQRLGRKADDLAAADPLLSPARALQALQEVVAPTGVPAPAPTRRIELAAALAQRAALSSRLELYPRGMAAARALRLALGALAGAATLPAEEIRRRVTGRYPEAAPLPERPALDALLRDAGSLLHWNPAANDGRGAYQPPTPRKFVTVASSTRYTHAGGGASLVADGGGDSDEADDAAAFDDRLRRALANRAFLALTVSDRKLAEAERALAAAFDVDAHSADELLIRHMKEAAREAGADWGVVLRADSEPAGSTHRANLLRLVGHRALPRVADELASAPRPVLLTRLGLLARYDQMAFLDRLRDTAGGPQGPPGVWLLVPADPQQRLPMVDGQPVPVITSAQWAPIPRAWLAAR